MIASIFEKPVRWLIGGAILFLLVGFTVNRCTVARQAGAEARLERATGQASSESAKDAVDTLEGVSGRAQSGDAITRENENAIRKAPGADAIVDPAVADAGLDSLCRRRVYQCEPKCVQRAVARGVANAGAGCAPASR